MNRLLCLAAATAALFGFFGLAQADNHHNGHDAIRGKPDGKHQLHTVGNHTAHAHVKGGKVAQVEVNHKKKGQVNVRRYKSSKKHHASADGARHHYVSFDPGEEIGGVTAWVGFGYLNDNNQLVIIWFPVNIVLNGDAGCVGYNPA